MVIRANIDDLTSVQACAAAAYMPYIAEIGQKPAPMVANFSDLIQKQFLYIEKRGEQNLTGFIVFYPIGDIMHLENVAVHPMYQGQGVGGRLIASCEDTARKLKLRCVELYTNEKMCDNLKMYAKLGYKETDRRVDDGFARVYFRKTLI